jgi:hypothetical protein
MMKLFATSVILLLLSCFGFGFGFGFGLLAPSRPDHIHRNTVKAVKGSKPRVFLHASKPGKPIEIDDVMLEAEAALSAAQDALIEPTTSPNGGPKGISSSSSKGTSVALQFTLSEAKDIISSTMGGIVLGSFLGFVALYEIPDIDLLVAPVVPPLLLGAIFGTIGLVGGLSNNDAGKFVRSAFGGPTEAVVAAIGSLFRSILEALGLAAKRQVEKTTSDIKAIPRQMADSAARKAEETVNEIVSFPSKVGDAAKRKATETVDGVIQEVTSLPRRTTER